MDQNERGMDMFPFYVVVVGGKNMKLLNNSDALPSPNLVLQIRKFKVSLKSRHKALCKTKVAKETRDPVWDQIFSFQYIDITETFTIECNDDKSGELLGEVKIKGYKIQQLIEDGLGVQKFALKDKRLNIGGTKEDLGEIYLEFFYDWKWDVTISPTDVLDVIVDKEKHPKVFISTTVLNFGHYHFTTSISDCGWEDEVYKITNLSGYHKIRLTCYSVATKIPIGECTIEIDSLRDDIESVSDEKICQVEIMDLDERSRGFIEFKVLIEENVREDELAKNDTVIIDVIGAVNVPSNGKNGLSKPIVVLKASNGKEWSTEAISDSIHPVWQHANYQLENAKLTDVIVMECYSGKKFLGGTSMEIRELKDLTMKKKIWDDEHFDFLTRYSKSISQKYMSQTLDEISISKGLETIGEAKRNFLRDKRFDAEREKKVYQSLWININVDHKIREASQRLRSEALGGVEQYMEKITKLLQAKHQQQFEKDYFKNEKLSKTLNKGGEKLAFLKHSAMSQLKDQKIFKNYQDKMKEAESDYQKLIELLQHQYLASYSLVERRTLFGEVETGLPNIGADFMTQLILNIKFQDPVATLRNKQMERTRKKNQGLVYRVKQARATYKFVTNTKVADVKIVEILKAFRGNIRKGNISRKKFEKVIKEFELEEFPVDFFFALFDRDKKGYVEFKTLVQGFNLIMKGTPEEKLQLAFEAFSNGTNGSMSRDDLRNFLKMVIINASKLLERLIKTIKEGFKDIKEEVVTTRTFQRAITIGQQSVGVGDESLSLNRKVSGVKSKRRKESRNELASDHSCSINDPEKPLVVRSRFESRNLAKKSGDNPLAKAKSESVYPKHINSPPSQLPPTKSQSLNVFHSTHGHQLKGEDDVSEDKRSHNDMVSVQSTGGNSPEKNEIHEEIDTREDRDIAETLMSFLNDTTINNIVNFCFKIMGSSKEEFITFDKILEFAKNEPIVANFFGFINQPGEKSKKKKKKNGSKFSVYKIYMTFLYIEEKGGITKKALKDALDILDIDKSIIPLDTIFLLFDRNDTGILDFSDLFNAFGTLLSGDIDDKLELIFSIIDRNADGRASRQDIFHLLQSLFKNTAKLISKMGKVLPGKFAEKTTDSICEALVKDNTIRYLVSLCFMQASKSDKNSISLEEFKAWVISEPLIEQLLSSASSSKNAKVYIKTVDFPLLQQKRATDDVKSLLLVNETIELEKEVRELAKDKKIKYNELKLFLENQTDLKIQSLIIQDRLSKLPPTAADEEKERLAEQIEYLNSLTSQTQVELMKHESYEMANKIKERTKVLESYAKLSYDSVKEYYLNHDTLKYEVVELEKSCLRENRITFSDFVNIFKEFAQNGGITKEDLSSIIKMLGLTTFPIDFVFRVFDKDNDNILNFGELIGTLTTLIGSSDEDKFKLVFDAFDLDRAGLLTLDGLTDFFQMIYFKKEKCEEIDTAIEKALMRYRSSIDENDHILRQKDEVLITLEQFKDICLSMFDDCPFIRKYFGEESFTVRSITHTLKNVGNKVLESHADIKTTFDSLTTLAKEMSHSISNLDTLPKPYQSDGMWEKHIQKSRKLKEIRRERWMYVKKMMTLYE